MDPVPQSFPFNLGAWPGLFVLPGLRVCGGSCRRAGGGPCSCSSSLWGVRARAGSAEAIPLPDASQDAVTSIFTFHELPPEVRRAVIREAARVLKPAGRFVIVDSVQHGDVPDYDGLLELFPQN